MLTLSAATPASSAFVILPNVLHDAGPGTFIALLAAALIAVLVAQAYAELASAFPHAGGEYAFVRATIGTGPSMAMLAVNGANCFLTIAVFSRGAADYLAPSLPGGPTGAALAAAAMGVGLLRLSSGALVTGVFLAVELVALALVAGLGIAQPQRPSSALVPAAALAPMALPALALGATSALFVFDGYGTAVYFAEELRDASRRVAGVVLMAFGAMAVIELGVAAALMVGARDVSALGNADSPLAAFVAERAGPGAARAMSLAVGLAVWNAAIAAVLLTARQLFAWGRDGLLGAPSKGLAAVTPRGVPRAATLATGAAGVALCLLPMKLLLLLTGTGLAFVYAGLALAMVAGRRSGATAHAPHRAPGGLALPVLLLIVLAGVIALGATEADGRISVAFTLTTGAAAWALWRVNGRGRAA
jgi:amino acid transporter